MKRIAILLAMIPVLGWSQTKFAQLDQELPTPNEYRTGSGAPGHNYYQQKADYKINVEIDDATQILKGDETITYTNNSPDVLSYLWLQLDQNLFEPNSDARLITIDKMENFRSVKDVENRMFYYDGGFKIDGITTTSGAKMTYAINKTMLRIDLDKPLKSGAAISFKVKWWYNINDRSKVGGRSGLEYFPEEDNYIYTIAQWFPRMCVYNDVEGWQNKQFLGRGEFALPFGDYEVNLTVPADHVCAATGVLQNASSVLTSEQRSRMKNAETAKEPIMIVTPEEALEAEKNKASGKKTWTYKATNVRDFAFANSRKFIWDAQGVNVNGKTVMCMSAYPKRRKPTLGEIFYKVGCSHNFNLF